MDKIYDRNSARNMDRVLMEKGYDETLLMESAAFSFVQEVERIFPSCSNIAVIAGKGNNGGDAYAISRLLLKDGYRVSIASTCLPSTDSANYNFEFIRRNYTCTVLDETSMSSFFNNRYDLIIDGIFGTGFHSEPDTLQKTVISMINNYGAPVWSIDIPSGTEADTGISDHSVKADVTITFQHAKAGHLLGKGRINTGKLIIKTIADEGLISDIGCNMYHVDSFRMKDRGPLSNKYDHGKLAVIAGSREMTGASIMAVRSAFASGTGIITYLGCDYSVKMMQSTVPEAMCRDISDEKDFIATDSVLSHVTGYDCVLLGPGLGRNPLTLKLVRDITSLDIRKIIDADALYHITLLDDPKYGKNTVITPHTGEFSRLTGLSRQEIENDPVDTARDYAKKHGITVLLKGHTTVVTDGTDVYLITAGTPGMAKAGSGDVLSGVTASLLAQGYDISESAYGAAYLCGRSAELAETEKGVNSITPSDTILYLSKAIRED